MCEIDNAIAWLVRAYSVLLLIYALISWIPDIRGRWVEYISMLVDPVLAPVRRIIPPLGGFDIAFLVVIVVLNYLILPLLDRVAGNACY
jgi:YggT family protein